MHRIGRQEQEQHNFLKQLNPVLHVTTFKRAAGMRQVLAENTWKEIHFIATSSSEHTQRLGSLPNKPGSS